MFQYRKEAIVIVYKLGLIAGVYLVANIGELQCSYKFPLLGSALAIPWLVADDSNLMLPSVTASILTWWKGLRWRNLRKRPHSLVHSALCYCSAVLLWISVLMYCFYFSAFVSVGSGEKVQVRIALGNFFKSSAWVESKLSMFSLYDSFQNDGWSQTWDDGWDMLDFSGEKNSLKVNISIRFCSILTINALSYI